ncbi:GDP-mannose 4,6-dehydratase [Candidatus Pacearchaeota archaeon]|nr:GDP-mannose 4,6-dehydratase [Candidatus Pacearchaeota archaeon]
MKVVYITGCLGFMGSYVTRTCLKKGWYVKGVDKMTYSSNPEFLEEFERYPNFSFIKSDINDLKFLYECDYVINTAAETHVGNSITNSDEFITSNINGVHNLLELTKNYRQETSKTPVLLHFSTDEVYGDITSGAYNEGNLLRPGNPYSATKAAADMLILAWNKTYGVPYIIVRPTNNYGIGQYVEKLIPKAIKYLKLGRKIPLHDWGRPIRNWLHAQDTADAVMTIIESGVQNEIYNISGSFEQTNLETCQKIVKLYNGDENVEKYLDFTFSRKGQDVRYALDDSKIKSLGWKPKSSFEKELRDIIEHYKNKFIW